MTTSFAGTRQTNGYNERLTIAIIVLLPILFSTDCNSCIATCLEIKMNI